MDSPTTRPTPDLESLRSAISGAVVGPADERYDAVRMPWSIREQRPAAVVEVATEEDVVAAVSFAARHGLKVAAQPTGHSATWEMDDVVLLRTRGLADVRVDPRSRMARIGAGALWREVQPAAGEHGLAGLAGTAPHVGVVGYTLGGGFSWLGRAHGLCANRLRAADVVLADGTTCRADADHEPDLLWALRGGGGNFAIVTAIELELVEQPEVVAGTFVFPLERAAEALPTWREWLAGVPDELSSVLTILRVPDIPMAPEHLRGQELVVVGACHAGDPEDAEQQFAPLRELGPMMDTMAPMPPSELGAVHQDPEDPIPHASTAAMLTDLDDEAIGRLVDAAGPDSGSPLLLTELRHAGAALRTPPLRGGAQDRLEGEFLLFALGIPAGPMAGEVEPALGRVREAVAPQVTGELPLNFVTRAGEAPSTFRPAVLERLRAVKAAYDPNGRIASSHMLI